MILFGALSNIQGPTKRLRPGFVNFVPAVAYHFCLALPVAFAQPGDQLLVVPCSAAAAMRACDGEGGVSKQKQVG